jgi:hypothetical protein
LFTIVNVGFISGGIDEGIRTVGLETSVLLVQIEVETVGSEEDIAWQSAKGAEGTNEILGLFGISGIVDQVVAAVDTCTSKDDDVIGMAGVGDLHGPGGVTFRVSGGEVRGENSRPQRHLVAVVESTVYLDRLEVKSRLVVEEEVRAATGFDCRDIGIHNLNLRVRQPFDLCRTGNVIGVGLAVEEDFGIGEAEAQGLDVLADLRNGRGQVRIDEDVALRRGDQVRTEIVAAYVVKVAEDAEGCVIRRPIRVDLGSERRCDSEEEKKNAGKHLMRIAGWTLTKRGVNTADIK